MSDDYKRYYNLFLTAPKRSWLVWWTALVLKKSNQNIIIIGICWNTCAKPSARTTTTSWSFNDNTNKLTTEVSWTSDVDDKIIMIYFNGWDHHHWNSLLNMLIVSKRLRFQRSKLFYLENQLLDHFCLKDGARRYYKTPILSKVKFIVRRH